MEVAKCDCDTATISAMLQTYLNALHTQSAPLRMTLISVCPLKLYQFCNYQWNNYFIGRPANFVLCAVDNGIANYGSTSCPLLRNMLSAQPSVQVSLPYSLHAVSSADFFTMSDVFLGTCCWLKFPPRPFTSLLQIPAVVCPSHWIQRVKYDSIYSSFVVVQSLNDDNRSDATKSPSFSPQGTRQDRLGWHLNWMLNSLTKFCHFLNHFWKSRNPLPAKDMLVEIHWCEKHVVRLGPNLTLFELCAISGSKLRVDFIISNTWNKFFLYLLVKFLANCWASSNVW